MASAQGHITIRRAAAAGKDGSEYEYAYYRVTDETVPPAPLTTSDGSFNTAAWYTQSKGVTATYKCEYMTMRKKVDGTWSSWSTPVIWARYGADGKGIASVQEHYAVSAYNTQANAPGSWSDTFVSPTESQPYIWNYETITYTDNTTKDTEKRVIGMYTKNGKGISSITEYYARSSSTTAPADSAFSTSVPTTDATYRYLWNYEKITYSDGTSYTSSKRIIGTYGEKGDTGAAGADAAPFHWNLFKQSDFVKYDKWGGVSASMITTSGYNGYRGVTRDSQYICYQWVKLKDGKQYTLSFYAKGSGTIQCISYINDSYSKTIGTFTIDHSSSWKRYSCTFTPTGGDVSYAVGYFRFTSGSGYISCPKLEEGSEASAWCVETVDYMRGKTLRGPQKWEDCAIGYQFYTEDSDDTWRDIVIYNDEYYECKVSHTKTAANYPGSTVDTSNGYWEKVSKLGVVATDILLSKYILAENLGVKILDVTSNNINYKIDGNGVVIKNSSDTLLTMTGSTTGDLTRGAISMYSRNPSTGEYCQTVMGGDYIYFVKNGNIALELTPDSIIFRKNGVVTKTITADS